MSPIRMGIPPVCWDCDWRIVSDLDVASEDGLETTHF